MVAAGEQQRKSSIPTAIKPAIPLKNFVNDCLLVNESESGRFPRTLPLRMRVNANVLFLKGRTFPCDSMPGEFLFCAVSSPPEEAARMPELQRPASSGCINPSDLQMPGKGSSRTASGCYRIRPA
jgi:hypothetical protein